MRKHWKELAAVLAVCMALSVAAAAQYRDDRGYDNGYYQDRDHDGDHRGYNGYGYYDRGGYYGNYLRQASEIGYQDGLRNGEHDRRNGKKFRPTHGEDYEHATRGYNSAFASKRDYKDAYRSGYEQGYQRGYGSYSYRW